MPIDELVRKPVQYLVDRERALIFCHLRIEQYLEQQIAKLTGQFIPVAIVDSFQNFVGFLDGVRLDGVEGLLAVPRASSRSPEARHDRNCSLETLPGSRHGTITVNE